MASYAKSELQEKVLSLFDNRTVGLSCKELATLLDEPPKNLNQTLKNLTGKGLLFREKQKRQLDPAVFIYRKECPTEAGCATKKKTCDNCQWFSGLEKCILLLLVKEEVPWALRGELLERSEAISLNKVERCPYFSPRNRSRLKSKTMQVFVKQNTDKATFAFRCPVDRCGKVIEEFSASLQRRNIGANAVYCPHCGSPINFAYNEGLDRYQVQYYDGQHDILQASYNQITGLTLKGRYEEERQFGFSIVKPRSYFLDLDNELIYVGVELLPESLVESKDLAYFSLRQLDYIAVKHFEDYEHLEETLHKVDPVTNRELYYKIQLLHSPVVIESVEPTIQEIGGNEILIATQALFYRMFYANLLNRKAVLELKAAEFADGESREEFKQALATYNEDFEKYASAKESTFQEWQQIEGGFATTMLDPFKKEAEKYGFENVSREKARKVRGEPFLPYGLFTARTPKACLENGVNKTIDNELKKESYNEQSVPWNGLRGWCHRRYPFGLFLDYVEPNRAIAQLWIAEAIRNKEITPTDFKVVRGKRYEKYYCMEVNSHAHAVVQKIKKQTMQTRLALIKGGEWSVKNANHLVISELKKMLNQLTNSTADLFVETSPRMHIKTLWKKLQETRNKLYLTEKENQLLQKHVRWFFREEFVFEPIMIGEILCE